MSKHAKVAQLVEHDLAKVGVASSNLVFRSKCLQYQEAFIKINLTACWFDYAQMVELVDTQDLKSCDLKSRAGSIPALSTKNKAWKSLVKY
jgi:hypothetical protein